MVKYHRYNLWRKKQVLVVNEDDDQEDGNPFGFGCDNSVYYRNKRARPNLLYFLFISFLTWCLILTYELLRSTSSFSLLDSSRVEDDGLVSQAVADIPVTSVAPNDSSSVEDDGVVSQPVADVPLNSVVPNGTICCDRSSTRSDICVMKGDVRTDPTSYSVFLYRDNNFEDHISELSDDDQENDVLKLEKIKPYTRKWEAYPMSHVRELDLVLKKGNSRSNQHGCDVQHHVPAIFFSTGGYTGNAYHDINDGILPLYITSQHLNKKVVFVVLDYHKWWHAKYAVVLSQLSDYPVINFSGEKGTHCFPEAIVGLRIHNELSIDPSLMEGANKTILDFRNLLDKAYTPRIKGLIQDEERKARLVTSGPVQINRKSYSGKKKPKLAIISRNGSRKITNERMLVKMAQKIGFAVQVLRPNRNTQLAKLYRDLNSSDVMVGVHGAAMTYFLFMNPGSVFIQIIPLGTDWPAEKFYEEPAVKLGLRYIGYKIMPKESSLYDEYDTNDPVLTDPNSVTINGWEFTKKVYLDQQEIRLDLTRFRKQLLRAYYHFATEKNSDLRVQLQ